MQRLDLPRWTALLGLCLLAFTAGEAGAQEQPIVSNEVAVSSRDATLRLELSDGSEVEIALRGGDVVIDAETVGSYDPDGPLASAWRSLLGEAVSLNDGPLAEALRAWEPPADLEGDALELGRRIDATLEERLSAPAASPAPAGPDRTPSPARDDVLRRLLQRTDELTGLAEALEGLSLDDVRIHVDEDVTVESGEEIEASVVLVDGDLDVHGTVDGNVVLTDGALRIFDGGLVTGEVRLLDGRVFRNGGEIVGAVRNIGREIEEAMDRDDLHDLRDRIRNEVRSELRNELRNEIRSEFRDMGSGLGFLSPLRSVGRGIAGLLQTVISLAIAGLLGILVVHFFPENLEVVAENARRNPGRAAVVGVAGGFLLLPVWVLGMVALAISLIGIPVLLAWIPLFPLAACLAAGLGYLASARILGQWIAEQRFQGLEFLRPSNDVHAILAGLGALTLPFAAANVVQMGGHWLDFVQGLFTTVGSLAGVVAVVVGFGAVLITRAGRRPEYAPTPDPFDVEWPASSPDEGTGERGEEWEDLERDARRRAGDGPPGPGHAPDADPDDAGATGSEGPGGDGEPPEPEDRAADEDAEDGDDDDEKSGDA